MRGEAARLLHCLGKSLSGAVLRAPTSPREEKFMQVRSRDLSLGLKSAAPASDPNSEVFQIQLVRALLRGPSVCPRTIEYLGWGPSGCWLRVAESMSLHFPWS